MSKDTPRFNNLKRIVRFLMSYWVVMVIVAIPYLCLTGKFELRYLPVNLFALLHNDNMLYVSLSWYVKVNLGLLLIAPLYKFLFKTKGKVYFEIFCCIIVPWIVYKVLSYFGFNNETQYIGFIAFILSSVRLLSYYIIIFCIGALIKRYEVDKFLYTTFLKYKRVSCLVCVLLCFAVFIIRSYSKNISFSDVILAPVFCISASFVLQTKLLSEIGRRILRFIGKYSFQLWLVSGMFFLNTAELHKILYIPYFCIPILAWNIVICSPVAILMKKISDYLSIKLKVV